MRIPAHWVQSFEEATATLRYRAKGLFPSEVFLFHSHANLHRCDMIIESGTGWGGCTQYLSKLFPLVPIYSIDVSEGQTDHVKAMKLNGVKLITARSQLAIPMILEEKQPSRAAVLIDGPKGKAAVKLAVELLTHSGCQFVAVHDLVSDLPGQYVIHSHTPAFRDLAGHLDEKVSQVARLKHPMGPGLTIFENPYR